MKKILLFMVLLLSSSFVFADELTLKNSIDMAMEKSPAIIYARQGVVAADGKLGQAFGAILPNLSLSGKYGSSYTKPYDINDMITFGTTETPVSITQGADETALVYGYNLTLSQPIYAGALFPALDIAQNGYNIAKENLRKSEFDLKYNVVNSYYGVLRATKLYDLSNESLDMARSHRDQVKAMYLAGTATKADVLRSEVEVANMEVSLTKASNGLALAKDAFNNVLGRDLDESVALSEKEIVQEIVQPKTYKECVATAFDSRADWLIFQLNKKINEKSVDIAVSGYFPVLSLIGSIGENKMEYTKNDLLNTDINSWTVAANASWTLFDGLATQSRIKEANANLEAIRANEDSVKNGIILEVKDTCLNLTSAIEVIKSAGKAVESADENYRISKEKYRSGIGSNLEMIDAQTALKEAKTDFYQAQFDYQIAKAKLNQAIGEEVYVF